MTPPDQGQNAESIHIGGGPPKGGSSHKAASLDGTRDAEWNPISPNRVDIS